MRGVVACATISFLRLWETGRTSDWLARTTTAAEADTEGAGGFAAVTVIEGPAASRAASLSAVGTGGSGTTLASTKSVKASWWERLGWCPGAGNCADWAASVVADDCLTTYSIRVACCDALAADLLAEGGRLVGLFVVPGAGYGFAGPCLVLSALALSTPAARLLEGRWARAPDFDDVIVLALCSLGCA